MLGIGKGNLVLFGLVIVAVAVSVVFVVPELQKKARR